MLVESTSATTLECRRRLFFKLPVILPERTATALIHVQIVPSGPDAILTQGPLLF